MQQQTIDIMRECTEASDQGRVSFGEVVGKLIAAGVERYHADLLRAEKIYYMPSGESYRSPAALLDATPAVNFVSEGVAAAVHAIQQKRIGYREFCAQIAEAGCVGYFVSLTGRRAVYYGRSGDSYVEPFPSAA